MLLFHCTLALSLLVGSAWSYGRGGPDYYATSCDYIKCTNEQARVCARNRETNQRATFDNACEVQLYNCQNSDCECERSEESKESYTHLNFSS